MVPSLPYAIVSQQCFYISKTMRKYLPQATQQYIKDHAGMGFDELSFYASMGGLHVTAEMVKLYWNEERMGLNHIPKAMVKGSLLGDGKWRIDEDVLVYLGLLLPIVVPNGFVTDFASVPRPLWWLVPPQDSRIAIPALVHDYLYRTHWISRRMCDEAIYLLMKHRGAGLFFRLAVFYALRVFGWYAWRKSTQRCTADLKKKGVEALENYYSAAEIAAAKRIAL